MSTWNDKPNDYAHAMVYIAHLRDEVRCLREMLRRELGWDRNRIDGELPVYQQERARPIAEIEPHAYEPGVTRCHVCGLLQGAAVHSPWRRAKK